MLKYIKIIARSFYDSKAFIEISKNKFNVFLIALIVSVFTAIPKTVFSDVKIKHLTSHEIEPVLKSLPEFHVQDNELVINSEESRFEYSFSDGTKFLILDSEKSYKDNDEKDAEYLFRIYKDAIVSGSKNYGLVSQALKYEVLGGIFNNTALLNFAKGMTDFLFYSVIFIFLILDFVSLLLSGLFYSIAGFFFLKMLKFSMPYKNLYTTSVFAAVPATLAYKMVLSFVTLLIGFDFFIFKPSAILFYLLWGLINIRKAVAEYRAKQAESEDEGK
ncbi:MAG: DUF1189 family protein [Treponema sp.]|uniref:DUF1189 family protein n=1 Tax=Treponema sp. TaxID=166 RepID=UPI00298E9723|nr:DUF1189 family protein [Treponema sp.]MBR5933178.1 DUF1189 family protein [Treponema sp.]